MTAATAGAAAGAAGDGRGLDVVIPTFRGRERLARCLPPLLEQLGPRDGVIVVDDASGDGTAAWVRTTFPAVTVVEQSVNGGFARSCNRGIVAGRRALVAVLNDDCIVAPAWRRAIDAAVTDHPEAAAVACLVRRQDDSGIIDSAGLERSHRGFVQRLQGSPCAAADQPGWVLGPAGSAAVYRRVALDRVGLFDESLGSYYEDVDLALRLQRFGFRCWFAPAAIADHEGGASFTHYSARHVRLCVRNQLIVMVRDLPVPVLLRMLPGFVFDQARSGASLTLRHGRGLDWLRGVGGFLRALPRALRDRSTLTER